MKNKALGLGLLLAFAVAPVGMNAQGQFGLKQQILDNPENTPKPVFPVPSARQLKWNETEFYAFFHYGMNTYTNAEWGDGSEPNSNFNPTQAPNPRVWN